MSRYHTDYKGVTKDAVFRKGHVVTEEDIPVLLSVGKDNVYIWEKGETRLHENEAAEILREMCQGEYMHPTPVKEGKIELVADIDGLLKVDSDKEKDQWDGGADDCLPSRKLCSGKGR